MESIIKYLILLSSLLVTNTCIAVSQVIDYVLVSKTEGKMYLLSDGHRIKEYDVAFGANPLGHKQREGDERTPEGKYTLDYKKENSSFHKAIHISYPNEKDLFNAKARNVDAGGLIMIHGQKNGFGLLSWITQKFNWTNGCIAVTNFEMEEIWNLVKIGIPIEIVP